MTLHHDAPNWDILGFNCLEFFITAIVQQKAMLDLDT